MRVEHILETCLYVDDLDAAERFYQQTLGLTPLSRQPGRHVFLRCGQRMLLLFNPFESQKTTDSFPPHGATGPGHVAFGVREDSLDAWMERLARLGVAIEKVIRWPNGRRSFYFRDPAGNSVELATPMIWGIGEETLGDA